MIDLFKIGFLSVTLVDIIDIIIVAFLFAWVYRSLRGTVAIQILFGLVILIGLSFIADTINLRSTSWIIKTITSIWLLAFIILFQPEIRRLILKITSTQLFRFFMKSRITATIDEVVDAVLEMSEKHIGALIVFTRSQNVEMTVDTGIPLQAIVSKEILISIFNPKSPLHDGAVIIENQTIIAAKCVLPLSSITKVNNRNLGTRHRAALGLSEQADAIIIIISEETGGISIADGGSLILDISKNQLPAMLKTKIAINNN